MNYFPNQSSPFFSFSPLSDTWGFEHTIVHFYFGHNNLTMRKEKQEHFGAHILAQDQILVFLEIKRICWGLEFYEKNYLLSLFSA